jgi:hypothetical protein
MYVDLRQGPVGIHRPPALLPRQKYLHLVAVLAADPVPEQSAWGECPGVASCRAAECCRAMVVRSPDSNTSEREHQ